MQASVAAKASYSFSIDVNPSIELKVTDGLVSEAIAFNDDGQSLLLDVSVIGLEADAAVKVIVTALIDAGYISDSELKPHLIVTVTNGGQAVGEEAVEALEKAAEQALAGQSVECEVKSAYIPDEVAAAAAAYGLSAGRYVLLNYVAGIEAITVDEAIIKYGALKIGEMMEMFDGAKEAFKAYNKAAEGDEADAGDLEGMTPEQQVIFKAALDAFHVEIKAANDAFHQAFATIKSDTKQQIASARAAYRKGGRTDENYKESMTLLREGMLDARRQAIVAMKAAIKTAQAKFQAAVAALNLPEEENR